MKCTILITDFGGRRRIHVPIVFAKKTSVLSDVLSHADLDATAAFMEKKVCYAGWASGLIVPNAFNEMIDKTSQMIDVYRKNFTQAPVTDQIIFHEPYMVLPFMMLRLMR